MRKEEALLRVMEEFDRATAKNGEFNSRHEGWAVLREEVDELWDAIKDNNDREALIEEATQVGAMALRFLVDIT
jgi:NTP pyrophosphatase (non-canonical NTP hydrolase)